jgi:hypothetical protein
MIKVIKENETPLHFPMPAETPRIPRKNSPDLCDPVENSQDLCTRNQHEPAISLYKTTNEVT